MSLPTLHFVLAANNSSSQTRVTAEYANELARRGFQVLISVPRFDFYDFIQWRLRYDWNKSLNRWARFSRWVRWFALPRLKSALIQLPWFGQSAHRLDPRVRVCRYGTRPTARNMPDADVVIAFQCYLLGHLSALPEPKGRVIGSVRLDYGAGTRDPDPMVAEWRRFCNEFYQRLKVPLFAVSRRSLESARAMGIDVETVIPNGINTEEFTDGGRRGARNPLRVTLFTQDHPQKGQDFGCAVVERLRKELGEDSRVLFTAAGGPVKERYRPLFHEIRGYLTGPDYVRMFRETDIFIYPSLYEGFPAVPLEAMACGCALVTTRVSGIEEYGLHGENCLMADPHDVETMVGNVRRLIEETAFRDQIREKGLATAKTFGWDKAADRLLYFLKDSGALSVPDSMEEATVGYGT